MPAIYDIQLRCNLLQNCSSEAPYSALLHKSFRRSLRKMRLSSKILGCEFHLTPLALRGRRRGGFSLGLLVHCEITEDSKGRRFPDLWTRLLQFLPGKIGTEGLREGEQRLSASNAATMSSPSVTTSGHDGGSESSESMNSESSSPSTSGRSSSPSLLTQRGSTHRSRRMSQWRWNWNRTRKEKTTSQGREIWALLLQLGTVLLFMRVVGLGVPFTRTGIRTRSFTEYNVSTSRVNVSFSEFLSRIQRSHVESVEIDGVHFTYSLRPEIQAATTGEQDTQAGAGGQDYDRSLMYQEGDLIALAQLGHLTPPSRRILYTTTKPSDMITPYEKMVVDGVEFGAPDKRVVHIINSFGIALIYMGLLAGLSARLFPTFSQQSTGRMHARKKYSEQGKDKDGGGSITFADVAGVDEAKEELEEVVEFLKNPDRYTKLGAWPPRGILLVGPPGTGKTFLAKAVAGEADVPFISCSASEFVELYVGMGASRVRDLFVRAKKEAPSIIFIDEIDAVAKGRDGRFRSVGNDEREQTLNQLLTELDGFESNSTVIVLAATNRADVLDPAFRRPGRFDRIVMVEPPDRKGRGEILQVHVTKKQVPLAASVDLKMVAAATSGFTGADLANLVNEAALLAGRANKDQVGREEFGLAVERSIGGIEKKRSTLHVSERGVIARHEVGHAVVGTAIANLLPGQTRVEKLSILPRTGGTLGFTYNPPAGEDRYLLFVDELRGRLVTLLAGRAAEEVVYCGRVSTGALDDIRRATDVAYKAIAEYGLNSLIGPVSLATLSGGGLDDSGAAFPWAKDKGHVTDLVQKEVRSLLQSALSMALLVIRSNPTVLEGLGAQLEANDKMEGEVLHEWLNQVVAPIELAAFIKGDGLLPMENMSS